MSALDDMLGVVLDISLTPGFPAEKLAAAKKELADLRESRSNAYRQLNALVLLLPHDLPHQGGARNIVDDITRHVRNLEQAVGVLRAEALEQRRLHGEAIGRLAEISEERRRAPPKPNPSSKWTEEQREAALDLAYLIEGTTALHAGGSESEPDFACEKIAKIAHLFAPAAQESKET